MKNVVLGIVSNGDRILMTRRIEVEKNLEWQFPGGKVEEGETPETAVLREILEETNISCKLLFKIGERVHPSTERQILYYACEYHGGEAGVNQDKNIAEVCWLTVEELKQKITTPLFEKVEQYFMEMG